jgi:hypothetical protein
LFGQHLERGAVTAHRRGERFTDRASGRDEQDRGDHDEPGVVVDTGQHLGLTAVG